VIPGLHQAQVTIPEGSEDTARDFYYPLLGLKEIKKPESLVGRGGLWLEAGSRQVHLGVESGVDRGTTKAHLAYETDDLKATRRTLADEDYPGWVQDLVLSYERFETRDPSGTASSLSRGPASTCQPTTVRKA
jgi:catechol 2,3-dioxygenase-like lactoylglutathione lyase family enzyme